MENMEGHLILSMTKRKQRKCVIKVALLKVLLSVKAQVICQKVVRVKGGHCILSVTANV